MQNPGRKLPCNTMPRLLLRWYVPGSPIVPWCRVGSSTPRPSPWHSCPLGSGWRGSWCAGSRSCLRQHRVTRQQPVSGGDTEDSPGDTGSVATRAEVRDIERRGRQLARRRGAPRPRAAKGLARHFCWGRGFSAGGGSATPTPALMLATYMAGSRPCSTWRTKSCRRLPAHRGHCGRACRRLGAREGRVCARPGPGAGEGASGAIRPLVLWATRCGRGQQCRRDPGGGCPPARPPAGTKGLSQHGADARQVLQGPRRARGCVHPLAPRGGRPVNLPVQQRAPTFSVSPTWQGARICMQLCGCTQTADGGSTGQASECNREQARKDAATPHASRQLCVPALLWRALALLRVHCPSRTTAVGPAPHRVAAKD